MESFTLLCSAERACEYITVDLDPDSIFTVDIFCDAIVCVLCLFPTYVIRIITM